MYNINDTEFYFLITVFGFTGFMLIFWYFFVRVKKSGSNTEIECFFEKYLNELSEEETTIKINEIANINSQYPINDKKIAQALLRFYNKLNN